MVSLIPGCKMFGIIIIFSYVYRTWSEININIIIKTHG